MTRRLPATAAFIVAALLVFQTELHAAPPGQPVQLASRLTELSIEDLAQVTITSVSKREEPSFEAAAAIQVITRSDIRRSGVTSIPEALRLAPGVHVARLDANKWSVSIRGFADRFANKLLVLQDGRSIYTPTFGGVWWNIQDIMLEDIERIEVIRGPGATLWGANAFSGVINIITRSSKDTVGGLVTAGGGTWEKGFGGFRYGMKLGELGYARGYARYFGRDRQRTAAGADQEGDWDNWSGGFRSDLTPGSGNNVTLQGDYYKSRPGAGYYNGGNLLGRISHDFSATSTGTLQLYYMRTEQRTVKNPDLKYREKRDTFDVDIQHGFMLGSANRLLWGGGFRLTHDQTGNSPEISLSPKGRSDHLFNLFLQDEITLLPDQLKLTLGIRAEHNDYTGYEWQPTGRLLWTPHADHTLWAAVTRAVRTPTRVQDSVETFLPPLFNRLTGNQSLKSEVLLAYELGYRHKPVTEFSFDIAFFYNDYQRLSGITEISPGVYAAANNVRGESWGTELSAVWKPLSILDFQASYAWNEMRMHSGENATYRGKLSQLGTYPEQQVSLRSGISLLDRLRLDLWLRYVDRLQRDQVPDYTTLDARIAWTPLKELELSLVGQNLLTRFHDEFSNDFFGTPATRTERGMYGKLTWKF